MIFSSFGNVPKDFSRVARALDLYAMTSRERIIVQYGHTHYTFQYAEGKQFIDHNELIDKMKLAELVVLQGGWGTISEALFLGLKIVAVPRRCPEEHNHDQGELVKKLEQLGCVVGVYDENDLPAKIELARTFEFKELKRGNALPTIEAKLKEWGL